MHTAESEFSNVIIEYFGEIETKFEDILDCLSGGLDGFECGWKSRDTLPLIVFRENICLNRSFF